LTALIAYLTVVCHLPRQVVRRMLEGVLNIPISVGSTQHAWEEASAAVAPVYTELAKALPRQPVLNVDETGHRTKGAKRWLRDPCGDRQRNKAAAGSKGMCAAMRGGRSSCHSACTLRFGTIGRLISPSRCRS
jgi:hypothetical protein